MEGGLEQLKGHSDVIRNLAYSVGFPRRYLSASYKKLKTTRTLMGNQNDLQREDGIPGQDINNSDPPFKIADPLITYHHA